MFFARDQAKVRLAPELHVLYAEEKEVIIAKVLRNVFNAEVQEDQAMVCLVRVVAVKG